MVRFAVATFFCRYSGLARNSQASLRSDEGRQFGSMHGNNWIARANTAQQLLGNDA